MTPLGLPWNWLACGTVLGLSACAPPGPAVQAAPAPAHRSGGGACDATPAQAAVGQVATPQLADTARRQAGARIVRVIGHDDMVTKEYDTTRLNLQLDAGGRVVRVYCG